MFRVIEEARARGLNAVIGGRFLHINGGANKGKGVKILKELYEKKFGKVRTIGIGDAPNDIPLLESVDYPVVVGDFDAPGMENVIRVSCSGPCGFSEGIVNVLDEV